MGRMLTDLANVCRAAGLKVVEVQGWQTRARGGAGGHQTGGYTPGPVAVMCHHTASVVFKQNDVNYMTFNAVTRPIANLYLARDGEVWVMAAGATNTNGTGGPLGPVPANGMNSRAIGIEAANNGTGEPWPQVQQDAYVTLVAALCKAYGIPAAHVFAHFEWAPNRKNDPYGPSRWGNQKWNMTQFRTDVSVKLNTPPSGGDMAKMNVIRLRFDGYAEQLVGFHTSGETLANTQMMQSQVVVLPKPSAALKDLIEAELGHPLTPT